MKYVKAALLYLVPYMLYGEILYLSLKGAKDKTYLMFQGLFGSLSKTASYIAWGFDAFFILAGLAAIIVLAVFLGLDAKADENNEFNGFESTKVTATKFSVHEDMWGNYRVSGRDYTETDTDAVLRNIFYAIMYFIGAALFDVFGIFMFIFLCISEHNDKKSSHKN